MMKKLTTMLMGVVMASFLSFAHAESKYYTFSLDNTSKVPHTNFKSYNYTLFDSGGNNVGSYNFVPEYYKAFGAAHSTGATLGSTTLTAIQKEDIGIALMDGVNSAFVVVGTPGRKVKNTNGDGSDGGTAPSGY
ncbi:MAG: hypothetical protein ACR2PT_13865 [Endozoicomonas sp.]